MPDDFARTQAQIAAQAPWTALRAPHPRDPADPPPANLANLED